MDLKDKIKQLTDRLDAEKPQPVVAEDKQKPIKRDCFVTLSFNKENKLMQSMLTDIEALGFKLVSDSKNTVKYHTDTLHESDADELVKFMEKIKKQSLDVFYDVAFGKIKSFIHHRANRIFCHESGCHTTQINRVFDRNNQCVTKFRFKIR